MADGPRGGRRWTLLEQIRDCEKRWAEQQKAEAMATGVETTSHPIPNPPAPSPPSLQPPLPLSTRSRSTSHMGGRVSDLDDATGRKLTPTHHSLLTDFLPTHTSNTRAPPNAPCVNPHALGTGEAVFLLLCGDMCMKGYGGAPQPEQAQQWYARASLADPAKSENVARATDCVALAKQRLKELAAPKAAS